MWQSPDPILNKYLDSNAGMGGIYNSKNLALYSYGHQNPVTMIDPDGNAVDIFIDIGFVAYDIIELGTLNQEGEWGFKDPANWVALGGDIVGAVIPFATGVGAGIKAGIKAKQAAKGWSLGDDITSLTRAGNKPSWSTVRQRYWKNEALNNPGVYNKENLNRMGKGLAPQRRNEITGKMESMELHHKVPRRRGGTDAENNLEKLWPDEHAAKDSFRHTGNIEK